MKKKSSSYRNKAVTRNEMFTSFLKASLICLLITGCRENPSGPVDPDRLLPKALIISPPNSSVAGFQADAREFNRNLEQPADLPENGLFRETRSEPVLRDDAENNVQSESEPDPSVSESMEIPNSNIFLKGSAIFFEGLGFSHIGDTLRGSSLSWASDIDGELGTGHVLVKKDLEPGIHWIYLTVTGNNEKVSHDSVKIRIADADEIIQNPVAKITSLTDGLSLLDGLQLILEGTGLDPEEGELGEESLSWNSNVDGDLGTGTALDVTGLLSPGEHTITLTATNSKGVAGSDSVTITIETEEIEIIEEALNESPVAEILSLSDGLTLSVLDLLVLEGTGLDPEDGGLDGASLSWSSNIDGHLGTGGSLDVTGLLTPGEHTITLTVTDSEGAEGSDRVNITIVETEEIEDALNKSPVAEILSITDESTLLDGIKLILEGSGLDPEDGELSGASLSWSSDVDGHLGTGNSLTVTILSPGEHTITLTVTDSDGNTGSDEVAINLPEL